MPFPAFDMAEYNTAEFTRYVGAHERVTGAKDSRPTALQIVKDNNLEGTGQSTMTTSSQC